MSPIRQAVLGETLDKRISKYFEVRRAAEIFSNKLLENHFFMTPIATVVQRKATKSVASHYLARTFEQALTMKHDKLEDMPTTTPTLPKPVSSPSPTETDDEGTSYEDCSHRKFSLKRHHNRHRKLDSRSSSSSSRLDESCTDDCDSGSEGERVRHRCRRRVSCKRSVERDTSRIRHHKHRNDKDNSLGVLRPVNK